MTPLKPFEAMALERPMVVADLPSLREIVGGHGERGVLFRPETPSHLAARIRDLARHRDHRRALGAAGRAWVLAGRTWAGNARRYVDLYGDLLGRNGVAR